MPFKHTAYIVRRIAAAGAVAGALALPALLQAHDHQTAGPFHLEIGWGDEPALAGSRNSIEVEIADAKGTPIADLAGALSVEVSFGDARVTLPLVPSGKPGVLRAWIVPTRAGTYAFHITGRVKNQPLDVTSTCSPKTFDCVGDVSDLQFPAKDPSPGQLAESVTRAMPRADRAADAAASARNLAITAVVVAALALLAAVGVGMRKGGGTGA